MSRLIKDELMQTGVEQSIGWNGRNDRGDVVANGVYFYQIKTSEGEQAWGKIGVLR